LASANEFEDLINNYITPLIGITAKIGTDELKNQVALVEKAIRAQKDFISVVTASKKPSAETVAKLVEPTSKLMNDVIALRDANRKSKQFNHLSTLSEGISCLGWVMIEPTPGPFVNDARASSEFYSNKLLVEFKKTNQTQLDWVHNWNTFMKDLAAYIKKFHTTGLTWNPHGGEAKVSASSSSSSSSAPAPQKASGGPPPPPPPPPPPAPAPESDSNKPAFSPAGLFAEINQSTAITSGLKKVTKDMKNKYDPNKSAVISETTSDKKGAASKAPAGAKKGAPKLELTGNKWLVEWQENNNNIEIKQTELKQTVYIYKCEKSVVKISGKVNSITLDSCKRVAVVFEDALALCEMVNCLSVEIQCTGRVPAVTIDKCSGVQLFLSSKGLDVEIVSSKSDQMNVLIPDPAGGQDPIEIAIPEQFKTSVNKGKLVTTTVEHV